MTTEYEIVIDVQSQTWERSSIYIEAETKKEALKLFHDDPWRYEWHYGDVVDSEVLNWEVDSCKVWRSPLDKEDSNDA